MSVQALTPVVKEKRTAAARDSGMVCFCCSWRSA